MQWCMESLRDGNLELVLELELVLLDCRISAIVPRIVDASYCHGLCPARVDNCRIVRSQRMAVVCGRHLLVGGAHVVDWRRPQAVCQMLAICDIVGESRRLGQGDAEGRQYRSSRVGGE